MINNKELRIELEKMTVKNIKKSKIYKEIPYGFGNKSSINKKNNIIELIIDYNNLCNSLRELSSMEIFVPSKKMSKLMNKCGIKVNTRNKKVKEENISFIKKLWNKLKGIK